MLRSSARRRAGGVLLAVTLALTGCGASAPDSPLEATISRYRAALRAHDPVALCAQITPAFWHAMAGQLDGLLTTYGLPQLPGNGCVQGFRYLFGHLQRSLSRLSAGLTVRNVSIHGAVATATITNGRLAQAARFIRSPSGRWELDCCTGAQTAQLPTARWRVPSTSMEPTLTPGELVTSDNAILRTRPPALGDIVVLHSPADTACLDPHQGQGFSAPCGAAARSEGAVIMIKRVVGLPGDRIAIAGGHVVRDGVREHEPYIRACSADGCNFPQLIVVPAGTYFVLGDNRGDSFDSRFFGPVPRQWLVGVVAP